MATAAPSQQLSAGQPDENPATPAAAAAPTPAARFFHVRDLGAGVDYATACAIQDELAAARRTEQCPDTLLLLEHAPVYTLGRSATAAHVLWTDDQLQAAGIQQAQTTRGGDVTYHGPGQLVGYPIVHLGQAGLGVLDFVTRLEEVLIRSVRALGVACGRDPRNRGVWVGNEKLAAIGIHVAHQISRHGFALNVNTRLEDYRGIVACGLQNAGVTSLQRLLGHPVEMRRVKQLVTTAFGEVFDCGPQPAE